MTSDVNDDVLEKCLDMRKELTTFCFSCDYWGELEMTPNHNEQSSL